MLFMSDEVLGEISAESGGVSISTVTGCLPSEKVASERTGALQLAEKTRL
jgi:hypothetical protein